jgi:microcystin degradation protein MlrC
MTSELKNPRVFTGGLAHETHSFSSIPTPIEAFRSYEWGEGQAIFSTYRGTRTSFGGIIDGAAGADLDVVPGFYGFAIPAGMVPAETYRELLDRLLASLEAELALGPFDGVILVCHGAMVAEGVDDVEGEIAERVRQLIGSNVPLVMTLDYHGNNSEKLVREADLILGYDTYPHIDVYERGHEASVFIAELIRDRVRVTSAYAAIPVLSVPQRQGTSDEPMRSIFARAHAMEEDPAVIAITVAGGFCYSDVPKAGMSVVVSTRNDPATAERYARELRDEIWAHRDEFVQTNVPPAQAVRQAMTATDGKPAIFVDAADNIGGGAPGDGTVVLAELIAQGATGVAVAIADPEAVEIAFAAGVGARFDAPVGGKSDRLHGDPVRVQGKVRLLCDGQFVYRGSYMTGQAREMGRTAVIDFDGNSLILNELKTMPFDQEQLRTVGVSPEYCRGIVVKSATAWRAAYEDMAGLVLEVDTPGICTVNLSTLPYERLTRPIFPLDPAESISLPEIAIV